MTELSGWMSAYIEAVRSAFGGRVKYIGLQGSRARGEAGPESDIDVVCVLDSCSLEDLETYRAAVADLPEREKLCGFVSGAAELYAWDPGELFQFRRDTDDWYGTLAGLLPPEEPGDAERALRAGACGLYHLCCHNFLHGRSREVLAEGYKAALFSLRAKAFLETGVWRRRQAELERVLAGRDREVLEAAMALKQGDCTEDLPALTGRLLAWSREALLRGRPVDQRSKNG